MKPRSASGKRERLREAKLGLASEYERGELGNEQMRESEQAFADLAAQALTVVNAMPADAPLPESFIKLEGTVDSQIAERAALYPGAAENLRNMLERLAQPNTPLDEQARGYAHQAESLEALAVSFRAVATLARLGVALRDRM